MDDGRPPCERIIISHFDEKDKAHHLLAGKIDVERAALVSYIEICGNGPRTSRAYYSFLIDWDKERRKSIVPRRELLFSSSNHLGSNRR